MNMQIAHASAWMPGSHPPNCTCLPASCPLYMVAELWTTTLEHQHLGCGAHDNRLINDAEVDFRQLQRPAIAAASVGAAVHAAAVMLAAAIGVTAAVVDAGTPATGACRSCGVAIQAGCCQVGSRLACSWAVQCAAVYKCAWRGAHLCAHHDAPSACIPQSDSRRHSTSH